MSFFEMIYDDKNIKWYVLFAANGKVAKFCDYFMVADIEYFYPMYYHKRRIRNSERTTQVLQPIFRNLMFVKSDKSKLDPILKEIKLDFGITSDLYYRYREDDERKIAIVPAAQMRNFMTIVGAVEEPIIYLSYEEVRLKAGTKIRIIGGAFEGVEGVFMRIQGHKRVVVSLPNLFSVATAFIAPEFIVPLE
jgi:transcription antitermination factor NusG